MFFPFLYLYKHTNTIPNLDASFTSLSLSLSVSHFYKIERFFLVLLMDYCTIFNKHECYCFCHYWNANIWWNYGEFSTCQFPTDIYFSRGSIFCAHHIVGIDEEFCNSFIKIPSIIKYYLPFILWVLDVPTHLEKGLVLVNLILIS